MDWFEKLTGFREERYGATRSKLAVDGNRLRSNVNGATYDIGNLELVSLVCLRERVRTEGGPTGKLTVRHAVGDVRRMHRTEDNAGALFQVALQFNLLEMIGPRSRPNTA